MFIIPTLTAAWRVSCLLNCNIQNYFSGVIYVEWDLLILHTFCMLLIESLQPCHARIIVHFKRVVLSCELHCDYLGHKHACCHVSDMIKELSLSAWRMRVISQLSWNKGVDSISGYHDINWPVTVIIIIIIIRKDITLTHRQRNEIL